MQLVLRTALAAMLLLPVAARAQGQTDPKAFRWTGTVVAGRWVQLQNINGSIHVEAATGNTVEVTAIKRWRRGDPDQVRITAERVGPNDGDLLICALWRDDATCDESGYHSGKRGGSNRNDTEVEFTVKLPKGVHVDVNTVNGSVRVAGATAEVEASTVNGGVSAVSSAGPVAASTVNGNIDVRMGETGSGDLDYSTVNGTIRLIVPSGFSADVEMSTINGGLDSDFPMTVQGRVNPRHMRATIGKGGRKLRLKTVNGSVELRRA